MEINETKKKNNCGIDDWVMSVVGVGHVETISICQIYWSKRTHTCPECGMRLPLCERNDLIRSHRNSVADTYNSNDLLPFGLTIIATSSAILMCACHPFVSDSVECLVRIVCELRVSFHNSLVATNRNEVFIHRAFRSGYRN